VARLFGLPIDWHYCQRVRPTLAQSTLPARQRRANVRGAFSVTGPLPAQRIVLVDDVVTTGHTVAELAQVLRGAGATDIDIWCCARA
jgi:predicted amidophosphoribosyltransferase